MKSTGNLLASSKTLQIMRLKRTGGIGHLLIGCIMLAILLVSGCNHGVEASRAASIAAEANRFFLQGDYAASLAQYEKLIEKAPETADRVLFEMGIIYAYPRNNHKNYPKALECFQRILGDYPDSAYRRDSQMMMLQIRNVILKDHLIAEQQKQIDAYRDEVSAHQNEIVALTKKTEMLEQKIFDQRMKLVDKILIEKKERRLTLLAKGEAIKTYKIALGGNPIGPKERQGDRKTPEGFYIIESRNRHSDYHLSLRLSYPNDEDKRRAEALGVSPGGDIMIHGIKNGLSWVGSLHAGIDWTEGCIAVTNEEMAEIARWVPVGTSVEIRP